MTMDPNGYRPGSAGSQNPVPMAQARGVAPWVWVLIGVLAVVLIGGAGFLGTVVARGSSDNLASAQPQPTVVSETAVPTEDVADPALPTTEPAMQPTQQVPPAAPSPSPVHVQDYVLVDTPSQNISCELHEDWAGCSILERDFSEFDLTDCSDQLFSISTAGGYPDLACGARFLGSPGDHVSTMAVGDTASYGNMSCLMSDRGVGEAIYCEHQDGTSFWITDSAYSLG